MIGFIERCIVKISHIPAKCRCALYRAKIHGSGYELGMETVMHYPENIWIGSGSYINGGHIFASASSKIVIGDNCLISYCVHLRTDTHNYSDKHQLISQQGGYSKDIIIGNDVWIGFGAQVMPGVTIADGCVIGAGAVVTHSTEPYGVYVGVPAKLVKHRE